MKFKISQGIFLSLLLLAVIFTGCSGDSPVEELTEGVEGPSQVIVNEESDQFTATGPTGADYLWQVESNLGSFTAPNNAKTKFKAFDQALNQGIIDISVFIDSTEKTVENIEVLGQKSETEYAQGTFHSIAATADMKRKGYVAVGTVGNSLELDAYKEPYMVKADNRGITIDEKTFKRDGRFYNVQDFVRKGLGDYYYLIGYGIVNDDVNEAFVLEVNNKMVIKKRYDSDSVQTGDAYLRSGIISKTIFTNDHLIAVGNKEVNTGYAPYIIDINTNDDSDYEHHVLDNNYGHDFSKDYYNLESIVETDNGYIAVGFAGSDRENSEGIILELDKNFNVTNVDDTSITEKLFRIKKVENVEGVNYVVVGKQGYVGEIEDTDSGLSITSDNIGSATYRDVIVDGSNYVVVGAEGSNGVVAKLTAGNLVAGTSFENSYGTYLYSGDIATDGDYLLAGHLNETSYVVKIEPTNGTVVDRVKE